MLAEMMELRRKNPHFNKYAWLRKKYGLHSKYPDGKKDVRVDNFFKNYRRSKKLIKRSNALKTKKRGRLQGGAEKSHRGLPERLEVVEN